MDESYEILEVHGIKFLLVELILIKWESLVRYFM